MEKILVISYQKLQRSACCLIVVVIAAEKSFEIFILTPVFVFEDEKHLKLC